MSHSQKWLAVIAIVLAGTGAARATDLVLKKVLLSSAGIGYFEYEATVDGPAELGLDVPLDEVDDVLKSQVVFDDAGGVGGIELPGHDATHNAFGNVPFGPEALASPLAYLTALQGVDVMVQGPRPMRGRILSVESVQEAGAAAGTQTARTRVTLLTDTGLQQFLLEDASAVQIADPDLRDRVARALAAARHESGQNARHLTIRSTSTGHRIVRVGYVAVAPLWKATYRLVLPAGDADPAHTTARLQGWATLENVSGTDWSGVSLVLQYGNPVTFHQAIYQNYFVQRPEVPVEVLGRLVPDVDTQAVAAASDSAPEPEVPLPEGHMQGTINGPTLSNGREIPFYRRHPADHGFLAGPLVNAPGNQIVEPPPLSMAPPSDSVGASEGVEETVFPIANPISLAAGHTESVPILDVAVPAQRLSLANFGATHPISALRVRNSTDQSMPAGVLTLYDTQGAALYAGDARLAGLPAGETRLLPFAEDLRTTLKWTSKPEIAIATFKAAHGTLDLTRRDRTDTIVTITAPKNESRHLLVELPKDQGAIVPPDAPQPVEGTESAWRFAVDVQPGQTSTLKLSAETHFSQDIALTFDPTPISASITHLQGLPEEAKVALAKIDVLKSYAQDRADTYDQLTQQRVSGTG